MRRLAPTESLRQRVRVPNQFSTSPDGSCEATNNGRSKNLRARHACETCRSLKVRCLSHTNAAIHKCQRCARLNQECLVKPRMPRKPRKRTDTRVGELERKVEALAAAFSVSSGRSRSVWSAVDSNKSSSTDNQEHGLIHEKGAVVNESPVSSQSDTQLPSSHCDIACGAFLQHTIPTPTSLSSGGLAPSTATYLFYKFKSENMPHFPLDLFSEEFSEGEDATMIRLRKPTLFLAVITAAAGDYDLELHSQLNDELAEDFTKRIVVNDEKSIELVQALVCAAAFYHPPDGFEKLKYYQYIHMAWIMATDLGIGRDGGQNAPSGPQEPPSRHREDEIAKNTCRRTLLASYMSCLSVSRSSRRATMIPLDNAAEQCIEALRSSPFATAQDHQLIAWVRLEIIMKEATRLLGLCDTDSPADITDVRTQCTIKTFEDRLDHWEKELSQGDMHPSLELTYHYSKIYLHEIAFQFGDNAADFRPPFRLRAPSKTSYKLPDLQTARLDCVITSMASAHSLIDVFFQMPPQTLCVVPTVTYIRASYAVFILLRIFFISSTPGSELGRVLDPASVKIPYYLNRLVSHMQTATIGGNCRLATRFCDIFVRCRDWFRKHALRTDWENCTGDEDLFEPFRLLSLNDELEFRQCPFDVKTPSFLQRSATWSYKLNLDAVDSVDRDATSRNRWSIAAEPNQLDRGFLASDNATWQYSTVWGSQNNPRDIPQPDFASSEAQLGSPLIDEPMQIPLGGEDSTMDDPFDLALGFDLDAQFWDFDMGDTSFGPA